jgi:hypothetical protein
MYITIIFLETWPLSLRAKYTLRKSQNRVLRRIYRPKRDEVREGWRKLHSERLNNL